MRIDILTTQSRNTGLVDKFWRQWGWQPVYWDNTGRPPGEGRNRILDAFYDSDRTWLAMADDDIVIDTQRGRSPQFLSDPMALLNRVPTDISSIGVMNNIHHRVDITLNNPALADHWCFYRASWIGCLVFHRRTGQRFYNHPNDILEDMDWCLDQIVAGQHIAHCMNLVQKTVISASTLFRNQQERRTRYQQAKRRIAQSYPGITLTDKGKLVKTRLLNQYWPIQQPWTTVKGIGPCQRIPL